MPNSNSKADQELMQTTMQRNVRQFDAAISVEIRKCKADEYQLSRELIVSTVCEVFSAEKTPRCYQDHVEWAEGLKLEYEDVPSMIHEVNGGCLFVAVDEYGGIIGTIGVKVTDEDKKRRRAEVIRMGVVAKRRRQGIGRLLLEFIVEYARAHLKCESVWLDTNSKLVPACRLYESLGFKVTERVAKGSMPEGMPDFRWSMIMEKYFT